MGGAVANFVLHPIVPSVKTPIERRAMWRRAAQLAFHFSDVKIFFSRLYLQAAFENTRGANFARPAASSSFAFCVPAISFGLLCPDRER
jgi:hypothetical protein